MRRTLKTVLAGSAAALTLLATAPAQAAVVPAPAGVAIGLAQSNWVGWYRLPGSTVWSKANGTFAGAPVPVKVGSTLHLVAALSSGSMVHRTSTTNWAPLTNGAVPCSTPSAVASGTTIHVACGSASGTASFGSFDATASAPTMTLTALSGKVAAVSIAKGPTGPVLLGMGSKYTATGSGSQTWTANTWIRSVDETVWSKFGLPCTSAPGIAWTTTALWTSCADGNWVNTTAFPNNLDLDPENMDVKATLVSRVALAGVGDGSRVEMFGVNTLNQPVVRAYGTTAGISGFRLLSGTGRHITATSTADLTMQGRLAGTVDRSSTSDLVKAAYNTFGAIYSTR